MDHFTGFSATNDTCVPQVGADTSYPPSQQTMSAVYGEQGPEIQPPSSLPHEVPSQTFQSRHFNVRNELPGADGKGSVEEKRHQVWRWGCGGCPSYMYSLFAIVDPFARSMCQTWNIDWGHSKRPSTFCLTFSAQGAQKSPRAQ